MSIQVTETIVLDRRELHFDFIRAGGPGGQHVNKASTAVQLRFDAANSPSLPAKVREKLARIAGKRLTAGGVIIISASRFRSRERNRLDAVERLVSMIRRAAAVSKKRRRTRPTAGSKRVRLEGKRQRSAVKKLRRPVSRED